MKIIIAIIALHVFTAAFTVFQMHICLSRIGIKHSIIKLILHCLRHPIGQLLTLLMCLSKPQFIDKIARRVKGE